MEKLFYLKENHTDVKTEVMAGITTFMTMAYILAVNPNILSAAGMDAKAVLIATSLAAFVGTMLMAFLANYPFALAPGMGLNAYFAYTVVLSMGYSWQMALLAVFVEGIVFIVLSLTNVREAIFNAIPLTLKSAVSVAERQAHRQQRFHPADLPALQGRNLPQRWHRCSADFGRRAADRRYAHQERQGRYPVRHYPDLGAGHHLRTDRHLCAGCRSWHVLCHPHRIRQL